MALTSASMFWPASRACSHRMIWATPSMKMLTSSTSDLPRRSALEMSQVPPVEAESTPAVPRAKQLILFYIILMVHKKFLSADDCLTLRLTFANLYDINAIESVNPLVPTVPLVARLHRLREFKK